MNLKIRQILFKIYTCFSHSVSEKTKKNEITKKKVLIIRCVFLMILLKAEN